MDKTIVRIAEELETQVYKDPMHGDIAKTNFLYGAARQKLLDIDKGKKFIEELILSIIGCEPKPGWIKEIQDDYVKLMEE